MNCTLNQPETKSSDSKRSGYITPPTNVRESKDGYLLEAEMPGVTKGGLAVTIDKGTLTITGSRSGTPANGQPVYRESRTLDYRRAFELDPSIDSAKITAKIEQGVLTLHLPKTEAVKPRQITVTD